MSGPIFEAQEDTPRRRWPLERRDFTSVEDLRAYLREKLFDPEEFKRDMPIHLWLNQVPFLDQL